MTRKSDELKKIAACYSETLKSDVLGRPFRFESAVRSTNDVARQWVADGAVHGAMVFADEQTHGKGRHGRVWRTQPGVNLTFSLVLRPELATDSFPLLALVAALAVVTMLERHFPALAISVKWPNDVLIDRRKCAGILLESSIGTNDDENYVIMGVGINVNQISFPEELQEKATSLFLETGLAQDRIGLLVDFLVEMEDQMKRLMQDKSRFLRNFEGYLAGIGAGVHLNVLDSRPAVSGTILGITRDGSLRLRTESGTLIVNAGDVTFDDATLE